MVFTTPEKCHKFIRYLSEKDDSVRYMNIVSGSFEHMIDIANQTHRKLVVDFPVSNPSKKYILYDSESKRINASIALRL